MEKEEKSKIEFHDKRRIKSADDALGDVSGADLERLPTALERVMEQAAQSDARLKEYITASRERMAELDKVRKRLEADAEKRALTKFGEMLKELFGCLDDFDRAIGQAEKTRGDDPLLEGVRLMREGLFRVLTAHGLEVINCAGEPFDPERAQAIATEPVEDESKDNIVIEQLAPGYAFDGRVLRPALVRVGQKA
ncbi:MAG: nucleotide exchange factor GrpE [Candidatus Nitrospinota bacterium M3_3B_026]